MLRVLQQRRAAAHEQNVLLDQETTLLANEPTRRVNHLYNSSYVVLKFRLVK